MNKGQGMLRPVERVREARRYVMTKLGCQGPRIHKNENGWRRGSQVRDVDSGRPPPPRHGEHVSRMWRRLRSVRPMDPSFAHSCQRKLSTRHDVISPIVGSGALYNPRAKYN
ncbi:hypothetical protein E4U59_003903 [Claviceps monticola]|nr:hypothetical protein E4U59_003903 [Claviceps monticola]